MSEAIKAALTPPCGAQEWLMFALVGLLFWLLMLPVALLTQHLWAPFDVVHSVTTDRETYQPGDEVRVTWDLEVHNRYTVEFVAHLIETTTGRIADRQITGPSTGRIGRFTLNRTSRLPGDAGEGEWCRVVTGTVTYNVLLTATRTYPRVCFEVRW